MHLLFYLFLLCTAKSAWACGNSAAFFGCSAGVYYEIPEEWDQIKKPFPEESVLVHPPLPSQVRVPATKKFAALNYNDLYAEQFAQYVDRYPLRNLFDAKTETAWVEGLYGNGRGFHFLVESNEGPLKIVGLQVINGYAKNKKTWAGNNRVKKISIATGKSAAPVIVELKDVMTLQKISFSPIEAASFLVKIEDTYPGTAPENDTALSELKFILADGRTWPASQKHWLETIPGSKFFPAPDIITDVPLAMATADVRVVDASGKTIFSRHFPDEGGDANDEHNVEPHANLFSKNRYLLRGGFLVDLQKGPIKEKELNSKILRTKEQGHTFYPSIYPIRFTEDETQVCIYDDGWPERNAELLVMKIPEGNLIRKKLVGKNVLGQHEELSKFYAPCGSLLH